MADALRLEVAPASAESGSGFEVRIFVNETDVTRSGAGMGMDPYDVLVPINRFVPADPPKTFGVARCGCGVYGCGATDVTITRDGDIVQWEWTLEKPMNRGVSFDTAAYLDEVLRAGSDYSWETPDRTVGRLVLSRIDRGALRALGLKPSWVANDWRAPELFEVCMQFENSHQIFLRFPWRDQSPAQLAERVLDVLANEPTSAWPATWHAIARGNKQPPIIAGPEWSREHVG